MKKILLFGVLLCSMHTQAQLLKKLKEKAAKALETKPGNSGASQNSGNNNQPDENKTEAEPARTKTKWQPTSDCNKLFTLGAGETFLYDETSVYVSGGKIMSSFIVQDKSYKYYVIENGQRSAAYNSSDDAIKKMGIQSARQEGEDENSNSNNEGDKVEIGGNKRDPVAQQYSKTISNKLYIVFNAKNYGPYDYVAKMKVSPDKKKFWAIVTIGGQSDMMAKMGMGNTFLVNEANVKQKAGDINSIPVKMMVSQEFLGAAAGVYNAQTQQAVFLSSTGKKQEGNMMDMFSDNGGAMSVADNGDIISIPSGSPTQLLVNGNEAASFKVPVKNISRLFIMKDYSKSVYYQQGKLYKGDGSEEKLTGVMFPKFVTLNDKPCIYYYKIHETDAGEKDVYLCQKCL